MGSKGDSKVRISLSSPSPDKKSKIAKLFESMEYGPAPESPQIAYEWLESHNRSFGHFINNKWEKPEDRKEATSYSPATGM